MFSNILWKRHKKVDQKHWVFKLFGNGHAKRLGVLEVMFTKYCTCARENSGESPELSRLWTEFSYLSGIGTLYARGIFREKKSDDQSLLVNREKLLLPKGHVTGRKTNKIYLSGRKPLCGSESSLNELLLFKWWHSWQLQVSKSQRHVKMKVGRCKALQDACIHILSSRIAFHFVGSKLWYIQEFKAWINLECLSIVDVDYCQFGQPWRKRTRFFVQCIYEHRLSWTPLQRAQRLVFAYAVAPCAATR